jgi:hypothetical protein
MAVIKSVHSSVFKTSLRENIVIEDRENYGFYIERTNS